MKINWIFAANAIADPDWNIKNFKQHGQLWGSWSTLLTCATDHIICHDHTTALKLVEKKFHTRAKLYLPQTFKTDIGLTKEIVYYNGDFMHEIDNREDIVAMHLGSVAADIVILYGFDWGKTAALEDAIEEYKRVCYRNLVKEVIVAAASVQWIVVDHDQEFFAELDNVVNLSRDSIANVTALLSSLSS